MSKLKINLVLNIIVFLVVLLWSYTVASKLVDISTFKSQLYRQNFRPAFANLLLWLIPISEIIAILTLTISRTRFIGLLISLFLMLLFTGYILLVIYGYFDKVPCSCGGVLKVLSWKLHLWFNLFYVFIIAVGIRISYSTKSK